MSEKITSVSTPFDYRPVITGALTVALDKYLLEEPNMTNSLYLGAATVAGVYAGQIIAPALPIGIPNSTLYNGKTLELRLAEVGLGSLGSWGVNTYLMNNARYGDFYKKVGIISVANVAGQYINDYLTNKPMNYLG
jgi:hypothetical protein